MSFKVSRQYCILQQELYIGYSASSLATALLFVLQIIFFLVTVISRYQKS